MKVKEYLREYLKLNAEIDSMCGEQVRLRNMAESIGGSLSNTGSGKHTKADGAARFEGAINKLIKIENDINDKIDELIIKRTDILRIIDSVEDTTLRTLLKYRYIDGYTFERISVNLSYSWRQVHRLHSQALSAVKVIQ